MDKAAFFFGGEIPYPPPFFLTIMSAGCGGCVNWDSAEAPGLVLFVEVSMVGEGGLVKTWPVMEKT